MADRTAVTGNWHSTAASSTAFGGVATTAADNITIPNGVTVTIPAGITVACRSIVVQSGGRLTFTSGTSDLYIGDATAGPSNVALSFDAGSTIDMEVTSKGRLFFVSTSATAQTITSGGKTLGPLTFNGVGGYWQLQDALTCGNISQTNGHLDTNSQNITSSGWSQNNGTHTTTLGSTAWTINGSGNSISLNILGTATFTANTAIITVASGTGIATVGRDLNGASLVLTGTSTQNWNIGAGTWKDITRTNASGDTTLTGDVVATGTLTLSGGNSTTLRAQVKSVTLGTQAVISAAAVSLTDVDFMDIAIVGPTGSVITSDSFNRANGALGTTDAAAGGTGLSWTESVPGSLTIASNVVVSTAIGRRAWVEAATTEQYVEAKIPTFIGGGGAVGVYARSNGELVAGGGVYAVLANGASNQLWVGHVSGGVDTVSVGGLSGLTWAHGDVLGLKVVGPSVQVFRNGTLVYSYSSSAVAALTGTKAGIQVANGGTTLDDFKVSTVPNVTGTRLGDCLGNSGITFQASRTLYAVAPGSFSDSAMWSLTSGGTAGEAPPLPQDDVRLDASSAAGTYTTNLQRVCRNLDATGFTRTMTWASTTTPYNYYGNFTFPLTGATWTLPNTAYQAFRGRGSHTLTVPQWPAPTNHRIDFHGTYALGAPLVMSPADFNPTVNFSGATFDANGHDIDVASVRCFTGSTVALGNITVTLRSTSSDVSPWTAQSNVSLSASDTTIVIGRDTTNTRTFAGGGYSYGTLTYTVADSPGTLVITGVNTIGTLNIGPGRQVTFPSNTITTVGDLNVSGTKRDGFYMQVASAVNPDHVATTTAPGRVPPGDFTVDVHLAADDWTTGSDQQHVSVYPAAPNRSWAFLTRAATKVMLLTSTDGSASTTWQSTANPPVVDGQPIWLRACYDADNGSGQRAVRFYTSTDGASWSQLGTVLTAAGTGGCHASAAPMLLTSGSSGITYHRVRIFHADLGDGSGTPALDIDFDAKPFLRDYATEAVSGEPVTIEGDRVMLGDGRVMLRSSTDGQSATILVTGAVEQHSGVDVQDITFNGTDAHLGAQAVVRSNVKGERQPRYVGLV